jgi:hypothetical protein
MSYLAEQHAEWHTVYGANAVCPLDCYTAAQAEADEEGARIWQAQWRLDNPEAAAAQDAEDARIAAEWAAEKAARAAANTDWAAFDAPPF